MKVTGRFDFSGWGFGDEQPIDRKDIVDMVSDQIEAMVAEFLNHDTVNKAVSSALNAQMQDPIFGEFRLGPWGVQFCLDIDGTERSPKWECGISEMIDVDAHSNGLSFPVPEHHAIEWGERTAEALEQAAAKLRGMVKEAKSRVAPTS